MRALQEEIAEYAGLTGAGLDVLRAGVCLMVELFTRLIAEDRLPSPDELAKIEALGAERAAAGVPLAAVRRSFQIAMDIAWRHIAESLRAESNVVLDTRFSLDIAEWHHLTERMSVEALSRGYSEARQVHPVEITDALFQLANDLLIGVYDSREELADQAAVLGYDLERPHGLVLLSPLSEAGRFSRALRAARADLLDSLPGALSGPIAADPYPHAVVLVATLDARSWREVITVARQVAVRHGQVALAVDPAKDVLEVHGAYRTAAGLMALCARAADQPALFRPDDLAAERAMVSMPLEALDSLIGDVVRALMRLEPAKRSNLMSLIGRFRGNQAKTSKSLGIGRNTLPRWLKDLEGDTGLNSRGEARYRYEWAIRYLRLRRASGAPAAEGHYVLEPPLL